MNAEQLLFASKLRLETEYDHHDSTFLVEKLIELDIFDQGVKIYEANGIGYLLYFIQHMMINNSRKEL